MASATYNFSVTQGDSVEIPVQIKDNLDQPINLSTTTVTADIKEQVRKTDPLTSFTVTFTDAPNGKFTLSLTPTQTATLPITNSSGSNVLYYDVQFEYSPTNVKTEFGGTITVLHQVTV